MLYKSLILTACLSHFTHAVSCEMSPKLHQSICQRVIINFRVTAKHIFFMIFFSQFSPVDCILKLEKHSFRTYCNYYPWH